MVDKKNSKEINVQGGRDVSKRLNPNHLESMSNKEVERFLEKESIKVVASEKTEGKFHWYFNAKTVLEIVFNGPIQLIEGKKAPTKLRSKYAFIRHLPGGGEELYLVPTSKLQDIVLDRYRKKLEANDYRRPKDSKSTNIAFYPEYIGAFFVE